MNTSAIHQLKDNETHLQENHNHLWIHVPKRWGRGTKEPWGHLEAPTMKPLHTCFTMRVVVVGTGGQGGGLAATGESRAGGRGRHGGWPRLAAAPSVLSVLWGVHDLLQAVWTLVEDSEELSREGLQQLQGHGLVHVPEPVPALCYPLDLWSGDG